MRAWHAGVAAGNFEVTGFASAGRDSRGRREKGKKESRKGGEVLRFVATKEVD